MNAPEGEETIFAEALRLPPDERAAYLAQSTHGDAELRRRVESLLGSYQAGDFLEGAAAPQLRPTPRVSVPVTEKPGDSIGRYKLLQQIGEGGCGVVYMAEQAEPVRRRVALKIIKLGMDTKSVIARFEAERQALAMMDHPNIAKVFDAGTTEAGRPYFVMELVRGMKVTEFCDEKKLSTKQRLDLFVHVCQAIQHAHQKGIIHRDIKPSNILVSVNDGVLVPKVIDFGIAKATSGQQLTDKTLFTAFEQFIGTPAYMSPEQAMITNVDVDTRSDIYALGVLLYELLTGRTPFDAKELLAIGLDEMRRTIREKEPPRPSTRLSTLPGQELSTTAQRRGLEAPKLVSELRGDLDWIVMKALEKDRARRYETANGLAADIKRHLNNEPVMACPPSRLYRLRKTVRRNKLTFAATSMVVLALVIGLAVSSWMFIKEKKAHTRAANAEREALLARANESTLRQKAQANEAKAKVEAEKNRQITGFLEDMLKGAGPAVALGRDTRLLREILDDTAKRIRTELKDQPDVEAALLSTIGEVYRALGQPRKGEEMLRGALLIQKQLWGTNHLDVARTLHNLAVAHANQGQLAGAETSYREALEIRKRLLGPEHADVADSLAGLAVIRMARGDPEEAEMLHRDALAMRRNRLPGNHPSTANSLIELGRLFQAQKKSAEAESLLREALAMQRKLWGEDDLRVANLLGVLAVTLESQGNLAAAEHMQRDALVGKQRLLGRNHRDVGKCLAALAKTLQKQGKLNEIQSLFRDEVKYVAEHPEHAPEEATDSSITRILGSLLDQGEFAHGDQLVNQLLTPGLRAQPENIRLLFGRGEFLACRSRWKEAAADFSRLVTLAPTNEHFCKKLGLLLLECGELEEYQQNCQKALKRVCDTQDPATADKVAKLSLLVPTGGYQLEPAAKLAEKAVTLGAGHHFLPYFQLVKGLAEYRCANFGAAEEWLRKSVSHRDWEGDENLNAPAYLTLAMALQQLGKRDRAREAFEKGAKFVSEWRGASAGNPRYGWNELLLARILFTEAKAMIDPDPGRSDPKKSE